jgi:hypothetical protein
MSDIIAPVGFRFGTVYELNANGRPKADSSSISYIGFEFSGPKAYNLAIPDTRKIAHVGKDRVIVNDQLPTLEVTTAEVRVSTLDFDMDALLQNVKKFTVGQATLLARGTDQQGAEPTVGMLLYQQSKDVATGLRNWHFHIIPATQCVPIPAPFTENPEDHRYSLTPTPSRKHLWGVTLTLGVEGAEEAGIFDGKMSHRPFLDNYLGDGTEDEFFLTHPSYDNTYAVFVNGVVANGVTKTVEKVTFNSPPALDADIQIFYGRA